MENEAEFRDKTRRLFERIDRAFSDIDPDLAECEWSHGALVVQFAKGSRAVLSTQIAVRQVWLALSAKGSAFHFQWDPRRELWVDQAHGGVELIQVLEDHVRELTGQPFSI